MSEASPAFMQLQEVLAGRYSLEREIGRGEALLRFLARDVRLDRPVQIELLEPGLASRGDARGRFLERTRAAAGLFHPHIVPVHAVEEAAGLAFLVRAHIQGETLAELVGARGPLPPEEAHHIVQEVAWALAHAHQRGLVHGRLAPGQLLVEAATGRTLVSGFGLGELLDRPPEAFVAPEVVAGGAPTPAADLYALGACGRFALARRAEAARSDRAVQAEGADRADRPGKHQLALLSAAIEKCLASDPARRPASASAVAEEMADRATIPSTLPPSARRLLRRIRQFGPTAAIALLAVWIGRAGPGELVLAGAAGGLFAWMGWGLLRDARRVLRDGFDLNLVTEILEEEARELANHPDASPHRLQNMAIGCGGVMFYFTVVPIGIAAAALLHSLATGSGLVGIRILSDLSVAGLLVFTMLFLAGPGEEEGSARRWLDFGERMMVGRFGRLLFRFARVGIPPNRTVTAPPPGEPTTLALSEAAQELFERLPAALRRRFDEAPAAIRDLGEHALELRQREEELARALERLGGMEGGGGGDARSAEAAHDLERARERLRTRAREVAAALEDLRLGMLRLQAREGATEELTGELTLDLERARELGADAAGLALARDEVRRLLHGLPANAASRNEGDA